MLGDHDSVAAEEHRPRTYLIDCSGEFFLKRFRVFAINFNGRVRCGHGVPPEGGAIGRGRSQATWSGPQLLYGTDGPGRANWTLELEGAQARIRSLV